MLPSWGRAHSRGEQVSRAGCDSGLSACFLKAMLSLQDVALMGILRRGPFTVI